MISPLLVRTPISYITVLSSFGFMLPNDVTPQINELMKEKEKKLKQLKKVKKELTTCFSSPSSSPNSSHLLFSPSSTLSTSDFTISSAFSPISQSSPNSYNLHFHKKSIHQSIEDVEEEIMDNLEAVSNDIYATSVNLCNLLIVDSKYKKIYASKIAAAVLLHARRVHDVSPLWNEALIMMMKHDPRDENDLLNDFYYEEKTKKEKATKKVYEADKDFIYLNRALHTLIPIKNKDKENLNSSIHSVNEDSFSLSYEDEIENSFLNSNTSTPSKADDINDAINSLDKLSIKTPNKINLDPLSIKSPDNVIFSAKLE